MLIPYKLPFFPLPFCLKSMLFRKTPISEQFGGVRLIDRAFTSEDPILTEVDVIDASIYRRKVVLPIESPPITTNRPLMSSLWLPCPRPRIPPASLLGTSSSFVAHTQPLTFLPGSCNTPSSTLKRLSMVTQPFLPALDFAGVQRTTRRLNDGLVMLQTHLPSLPLQWSLELNLRAESRRLNTVYVPTPRFRQARCFFPLDCWEKFLAHPSAVIARINHDKIQWVLESGSGTAKARMKRARPKTAAEHARETRTREENPSEQGREGL